MYLGLDYGTSEIKALLIDAAGNIVHTHGVSLSIQRPQPHWSEQSAAEWWQATNDLMAAMRKKAAIIGNKSKPSAYPARCTARCCSMRRIKCCGR